MDIYQCVVPLYNASKVWGLSPFEIIRINDKDNCMKRLRISTIGILYSIFMCILITISVLYVLITKSSYYLEKDFSANAISLVISFLSLTSSALSAEIGCVLNRERLLFLLETIFEFETIFHRHRFNTFIKFEIFIAYTTIILLSIYDIWLWGIYYRLDLDFFPYLLIHFIMITMIIQYTNIIYLTYDNFKFMNLSLVKDISKMYKIRPYVNKNNVFVLSHKRELIDMTNSDINKNSITCQGIRNNFVSKLRDYRRYHYALHNICDDVNKVFGFQIIFFVLTFFISITRDIFYGLYFVLTVNSEVRGSVLVVVEQFCWTMIMVVELIAITVVCHLACAEAMHTGVILRNILFHEPLNTMLSAEIQVFLEQIHNRPLRYSACGLFNIDLAMLCSFIGTVATYIIVLIQ
ncbi:hypothetical protein L9F63_009831, partial [Diploptera punctata]